MTDFFVLYVLRKRGVYHSHKYKKVKEDRDDDFILIRDDSSVDPTSYGTVGVTRWCGGGGVRGGEWRVGGCKRFRNGRGDCGGNTEMLLYRW